MLSAVPVRHAYVHVPFCASICPFCSFHVKVREAGDVAAYLDRLEEELAEIVAVVPVDLDTLYVGGGTPSYLRTAELARLCEMVERHLGRPRREATLEVHPSTATASRVRHWVELGFTRLSIGAQSFDDEVLRRLGRTHSGADALACIEWALAAAQVTSVDLMMPAAGQDVSADVRRAVATGAQHISVYALTIEPGTPFAMDGVCVDDGGAAEALSAAADLLGAAGFERYEVSNYARPQARCLHNQAYWAVAPSLGIGPSASGVVCCDDGSLIRWTNPTLDRWRVARSPLMVIESDRDARSDGGGSVEHVHGEDLMRDLLMCGLRRVDGVDLDEVTRRSGVDPRDVRRSELARLSDDALVDIDGALLAATDRGRLLLDHVTVALW
ncbi:MAG: coproporphyrinogen-III oxidase family protein [Microthrixaceae bacterium]